MIYPAKKILFVFIPGVVYFYFMLFISARSTQIKSAPAQQNAPCVHAYACVFFGALPQRKFVVKKSLFRLV